MHSRTSDPRLPRTLCRSQNHLNTVFLLPETLFKPRIINNHINGDPRLGIRVQKLRQQTLQIRRRPFREPVLSFVNLPVHCHQISVIEWQITSNQDKQDDTA
ncbi:hypothetical protein OIU79_021596 [Salix purpurea]|uniref:Uncharacterized protein n=1 Tax=Salix purpurea TaxID=77065 RepID=A0A9Q0WE93_SALPP|nr:hypothetical protein OIU79_021596 [Salix purpurea]